VPFLLAYLPAANLQGPSYPCSFGELCQDVLIGGVGQRFSAFRKANVRWFSRLLPYDVLEFAFFANAKPTLAKQA
jgi:hypothetical protein